MHQESALFQRILAKWNQHLKFGVESAVQPVKGRDSNSKGHVRVNACAASIDAALSDVTANLSISSTRGMSLYHYFLIEEHSVLI
jgi:hypothetical protein